MAAKYWKNTSGQYIKSGGVYVKCATCPCGQECCFDDLMPTTLYTELTDRVSGVCAPDMGNNFCPDLNMSYAMTPDTACPTWAFYGGDDVGGGTPPAGTQTFRVLLTINEASPTECEVICQFADIVTGNGFRCGEAVYSRVILKTASLPFTFDFVSNTLEFCDDTAWPATIPIRDTP